MQYEAYRLLVQNSLARVVTGAKPRAESSRLLIDLHWRSIKHRIEVKIATITFRIRSTAEPSCLASLVSNYVPGRALRSADLHLLHTPFIELSFVVAYLDRPFQRFGSISQLTFDHNQHKTFYFKIPFANAMYASVSPCLRLILGFYNCIQSYL